MSEIYFIRRADGSGPIKIGCSIAPATRAKQIGYDLKVDLEVVASAPGDFPTERNIHLMLAGHRADIKGCRREHYVVAGPSEWFKPDAPVLELMLTVMRTGKIPQFTIPNREAEMAMRYNAGDTLQAIADDYGITRERVRQLLRRSGVPSLGWRPEHMRRSRRVLSDAEKLAASMYADGIPPKEIAERTGVEGYSLKRSLDHLGIPPRPVGSWYKRDDHDWRINEVARLYGEGCTTSQICERVGLKHQPDVYRYLHRAGVTPNRRAA